MYEFHYKYIKSKFDAKLLFTDTDSLVYELKTEDVYEDFYQEKNLFGFSDYPLDLKLFVPVNKKVIGKMKDAFKGKLISEFVGLKSKMHSLISANDEEVTKAKKVNKKLRHKEFVGTYDVCKISLSCFEDKRYVLDDGVNTLAYFHKDIKN